MRLSVIIVSYNVYPFLDNCLRSVRQALRGVDGEIIVVDNASVDRTPQLVAEHFPDVRLIANTDNPGFARANNQAIAVSRGACILLLNPDTIVSEDTFTTCLDFLDAHPEAGALGVKMVDGSGRFLPESKRGLPTVEASFLKMSGLYRLAPRSKRWNRYYQGHISPDETAPIEVLCGAFMMIRRSVLDEVGWLDEDFFMYGEDIDLSYRITRAGHAIYYLPETSIVHYKGESTRKSSLNYILTFYEAMLIFTRKHPAFSGQRRLIRVAIYLHGFIQFLRQQVTRAWPVVRDMGLIAGSYWLISRLWAVYYFGDPDYFPRFFYTINIPLYTLIMTGSLFLNGAYDRPATLSAAWRGFFTGVVMVLALYALLPTEWRTSRMVMLLGSALFALTLPLVNRRTRIDRRSGDSSARPTILVAGPGESNRIKELINRSRDHLLVVGTVSPSLQPADLPADHLGHIEQLEDIVRVHQVREIIFSAQDVPFSTFTSAMSRLGPGLRYMLAASTTLNIVGSMSKDTEGESYALRVDFRLSHPQARRAKRIFDGLSATLIVLTIPVWLVVSGFRTKLFRTALRVGSGRATWVGYHPADPLRTTLPPLVPGILHPGAPLADDPDHRRLSQVDYVYARDYHWTTDLSILASRFRRLINPEQHEPA